MKTLNHDSRSSDRDLKPGPPKYEARLSRRMECIFRPFVTLLIKTRQWQGKCISRTCMTVTYFKSPWCSGYCAC
jgi:hypothetical protein